MDTNKINEIIGECAGLSKAEKLELCCQLLDIGVEFDNHGQVVLYTGLSVNHNDEVIEFDPDSYDCIDENEYVTLIDDEQNSC